MIFKDKSSKKNTNSGFTLVEMIVVLVILGILASAAVFGIIAYIDMTRYNNNQRTAETIYQSAQASLNHMSENGTVDAWCRNLIGPMGLTGEGDNGTGTEDPSQSENPELFDTKFNAGSFKLFPDKIANALPGQSVHMRYSVTYNAGADNAQCSLIKDLIYQDFKSTDVFSKTSGIITIEFDVEKALDASGNLHLSASVCSVFYDSKRTSWDSRSYNSIDGLLVPYRDENYRSSTSLIGYYCGDVSFSSVDSVFVPAEVEVSDFTLRNGETLEMKWSVKSENTPVTGVPAHVHYTFSLYDADTSQKFCDLVLNENAIFEGTPQTGLYTEGFNTLLTFTKEDFVNNALENNTDNVAFTDHYGNHRNLTSVYTKETISDTSGIPITVYKRTIHTVAKVYVHRVHTNSISFDYNSEANKVLSGTDNYFNFPITISYEIYDVYGTTVSEGVYYSLTLDAMMSRNLIENATSPASGQAAVTLRTLNYSFHRLTGANVTQLKNTGFATNFYATMIAEGDNFGDSYASYKGDLPATDTVYATRALDDPVYLRADGSYRYMDLAATRENGKGYAVVNSYFGDLGGGSVGTSPTIGGTDNAVITSYRHLYNIRMLEGNNGIDVCYSIARNLNWYSYKQVTGRNVYSSEVVVFSPVNHAGIERFSPVPIPGPSQISGKEYGDVLNVVSFPSLPKLNSHSTLQAVTDSVTGEISVINNLQMRLSSFFNKNEDATKHDGYGLININYGNIINIRANGMTLLMTDTADGSPDDSEDIKDAVSALVNSTVETTDALIFKGSSGSSGSTPMGGLVGTNVGSIGSPSIDDPENNTVKFSNCIVTTLCKDDYGNWRLYRLSACGGIIGDNGATSIGNKDGYMYGHFEATGRFVSANWIDVGSILGYSKSDVDAFLSVNNKEDCDKALIDFGDDITSVLYATTDCLGGAVGYINNHGNFCQSSDIARLTYTCTGEGVLTVLEDSKLTDQNNPHEYAIDVTLDSHSYILMKTDERPKEIKHEGGIGGAVGRIAQYGGGAISIRVRNEGVITSSDGTSYIKDLGGAVGIITESSVSHVSIYVVNESTSRIGSYGSYSGYAHTTGGAVGKINDLDGLNSEVIISAVNKGDIYGNCSHAGPQLNKGGDKKTGGIGGAVGAVTKSKDKLPVFRVAAYNHGTIRGTLFNLSYTNAVCSDSGVGGTIGYIQYMPRKSSVYCMLKGSVRSNGNNAGGVIGIQTNDLSSNAESNYTTVTADLKDGSKVISDLSNAGGAIGSANYYSSYMAVRSIVSGSVSIDATANAGGVCGLFKTGLNSANSIVTLMQGENAATLSVRCSKSNGSSYDSDTINAGGLIGLVSSGRSDIKSTLNLPAQVSGNTVIVNVDCYDNAGGMIGKLENTYHMTSNITVVLNPYSHIWARNDNAGGAIGLLNETKDLSSSVSVSSSVILNSAAPIIKADGQNAGGIIGSSIGKMNVTSSLTMTSSGGYVQGGNNIGGCIGNLEGTATIAETGSVVLDGSLLAIEGTYKSPEQKLLSCRMGGCIGNSSGTYINGTVKTCMANLAVNGYEYVGGCIGRLYGGSIGETGHILYTANNSLIWGKSNIGGCIGKADRVSSILGEIKYSGESAHIIATSTDEAPEYAGGIAGSVTICKFGGSSVICFASNSGSITGKNYTGGIIGAMSGGSIESSSHITFEGESAAISGADYTGGIIGCVNTKAFIKNSAVISYKAVSSSITGSSCTGGIIGYAYTEVKIQNTSVITYEATSSSITGTAHTGGIIGYFESGSLIQNSSELIYKGEDSTITGTESTGGIFGEVYSGYSDESVKYTFTGKNITITGTDNVGGIIGLSNTFSNAAVITFAPVTECTVKGANYVGGIAGKADNRYGNGNFHKNPKVTLNNCTLTIIGSGYTGGAIGSAENNCYYSGASIELKDSTLYIESTGSAAGGNIGNLSGGNIGDGATLSITLDGTSSLTVKAETYAGGFAGKLVGKSGNNYKNTPLITLKSNANSQITVTGNTAAGGIIGYNSSIYGRQRNDSTDIRIPDGGSIDISSGQWGAIIGENTGTFQRYSASTTYYINLKNYPAGANANNLLFGSTPANTVAFNYSVNGNTGTFTTATTP